MARLSGWQLPCGACAHRVQQHVGHASDSLQPACPCCQPESVPESVTDSVTGSSVELHGLRALETTGLQSKRLTYNLH
eukprot:1156305-Pelagomonas_calceolata.AAC.5